MKRIQELPHCLVFPISRWLRSHDGWNSIARGSNRCAAPHRRLTKCVEA